VLWIGERIVVLVAIESEGITVRNVVSRAKVEAFRRDARRASIDGLARTTSRAGRKVMSELGQEAERLLLPVLARYGHEAAQLGNDGPAPVALMAILLLDLGTLGTDLDVEPADALAAALVIASRRSGKDPHVVLRAAHERLDPATAFPFGKPSGRPS
jgi:hypothetical protein